jgi:hypothetical protein
MMTAHVAGAPIEELIYLLAPAGGVIAAVTRLAWRRIRQALADAAGRALLDRPADASTYWIRMTSSDQLVDRTTTRLEDRLGALGYEVASEPAILCSCTPHSWLVRAPPESA